MGLPISSFLLLLLEDFGLQLQHFMPHSLLLTSIFVHLCEMFVGVWPCVTLFCYFFILVKSGRAKDEVGRITFRQGASCRCLIFPASLVGSARSGARIG